MSSDLRAEMMALLEEAKRRSADPNFQARVAALQARETPPEVRQRHSWERMGIPREFWDEFEKWGGTADACRIVDEFWGSDSRILLLTGEVGLAKTYSACRKLTQVGGRYARAKDIGDAFGEEDEGWIADLRNTGLLVVDEMGKEPLDPKGWAYGKMYDLIDRRQSNLRKTILLANVGLDAWKARYCPAGKGDPLYDRIISRGIVPKPLTGESLR